jgi:two-component system LytT family response regulator
MKAIIVDDERLARNELKRLLENFPTIEVIAEASNTEEVGPLVEELKPDVLFLDNFLPGLTCIRFFSSLY